MLKCLPSAVERLTGEPPAGHLSNNLLSSSHLHHCRSEEQEEIWGEHKNSVTCRSAEVCVCACVDPPADRLGQFAARQWDPPSGRGSTGSGQAAAGSSQGASRGGGVGNEGGCGLHRLLQSQWGWGGRSSQLTGRRNWRQMSSPVKNVTVWRQNPLLHHEWWAQLFHIYQTRMSFQPNTIMIYSHMKIFKLTRLT